MSKEIGSGSLYRTRMCAALKKADLLERVPPRVWSEPWVVHCQPAGSGRRVLDYLGRSVFRVALPNSRLESIDETRVTFRYRDNRTPHTRRLTLPGPDFIDRFLRHVPPPGCAKVRYYGIRSGSRRRELDRARALLNQVNPPSNTPAPDSPADAPPSDSLASAAIPSACPHCRLGQLIVIEVLRPLRKVPP